MVVFPQVRAALFLLLVLLAGAGHAAFPTFDASGSPWQFGEIGTCIGDSGFEVAQINGGTEFIFGTHRGYGNVNKSWTVLRWDPEAQTMQQIYTSQDYEGLVELVRVIDVNGDGQREILVGRSDGILEFYDAETKALIASLKSNVSTFTDAVAVDYDQDGDRELLLLTFDSLVILDGVQTFPNGKITSSLLTNVGGWRFYVGQLDQDKPLEILFTWGGVIEIGSWEEEWNLAELNPSYLVRGLIDRNGDGISEMLVTTVNEVITVDLASKAEVWRTQVDSQLRASEFRLAQLDDDPAPEFVFGGGKIVVVDSATGATESSVQFSYPGGFLAFADVDGDGANEALYWQGNRDLVYNWERLVIFRSSDQSTFWKSDLQGARFGSPRLGDVDGDGHPELVLQSPGTVRLVNPDTAVVIAQFDVSSGLQVLDVKDVNGDGRCEILMGGVTEASSSKRELNIFEYTDGKFSSIWQKVIRDAISPDAYNEYKRISVADLDGDGTVEIIAGWSLAVEDWAHTRASGIEVYDLSDTEPIWRSPRANIPLGDMCVADFDRDGQIEIAAVLGEKWLRIWNPVTGREEFKLRGNFTSVAPLAKGIALGHKSGHVSRFTARKRGYARSSYYRAAKTAIAGITPESNGESLWLATGNQYIWFPKRPRDSFIIQGDEYTVPAHIALYSGAEGPWIFASFHKLIRGFPLFP